MEQCRIHPDSGHDRNNNIKGGFMFKKIKIGNEEVEMLPCGASIPTYQKIFKRDFAKQLSEMGESPSQMYEMGFVMAKTAEVVGAGRKYSELLKLSEEDFLVWMAQYDPMDLLEALSDITDLYFEQTGVSAVPKDEGGQ